MSQKISNICDKTAEITQITPSFHCIIPFKNNINLSVNERAVFGHILEEMTFQSGLSSITSFKVIFFHSEYSNGISDDSSPYVVNVDGYSVSDVNLSKAFFMVLQFLIP